MSDIKFNPMDTSIRDSTIQHAQQERMVRDTLILQKVNKVHRDAFRTKFPGQVEHCMRLTVERLQSILTKKPSDLTDPSTWVCTAEEINNLSEALYSLSLLNKAYPIISEDE